MITPSTLNALLRRFPRVRVLVVGDLMLDEFLWGTVERISPEAPVPVVRVERETIHLGGAANVAHNLRALGAQVLVCGVVGRDRAGDRLLAELQRIGADPSGVVRSRQVVTTRKTRVIAHHQQVVRFDREQPQHPESAAKQLAAFIRAHAREVDAVLVSDYAKGAVSPALLELIGTVHREAKWPLVIDPKRPNFPHYRGATLVTPNQAEAADAAGIPIHDAESLEAAGRKLLERWACDAVLVTRGEHGMSLFRRGLSTDHFPARARDVFDVTGAGDTVVATCTLALAVRAAWEEAVGLANVAAGVVVGKVGTATVDTDELRAAILSDGAPPEQLGKRGRNRA